MEKRINDLAEWYCTASAAPSLVVPELPCLWRGIAVPAAASHHRRTAAPPPSAAAAIGAGKCRRRWTRFGRRTWRASRTSAARLRSRAPYGPEPSRARVTHARLQPAPASTLPCPAYPWGRTCVTAAHSGSFSASGAGAVQASSSERASPMRGRGAGHSGHAAGLPRAQVMDMEERQRSDQTARLVESLAAAQTRLRNVRSLCVGVWEAQVRLAAAAKGAARWPKPYGRSASNGQHAAVLPATSAPGLGLALSHICTGTGGFSLPPCTGMEGSPVPHPHRDLATPCHIRTGTWLPPCHIRTVPTWARRSGPKAEAGPSLIGWSRQRASVHRAARAWEASLRRAKAVPYAPSSPASAPSHAARGNVRLLIAFPRLRCRPSLRGGTAAVGRRQPSSARSIRAAR